MRSLGIVLVFIGVLLLLQQFHPMFISFLYPYSPYIKRAFWGITLISAGLYLSSKRLRRPVLVLYLIYLLINLVV
ncbi:hypothetical protein [Thermococcus sp.]